MAKNTPVFDDEIDLIELVQVFLTHKTKYVLLGLVGLTLGLVYTFQHEPRFETEFKVHVGHPAFTNQSLIYSSAVQEKLNTSELNPDRLPHYSFNEKTNLFSVISKTSDASEVTTKLITDAMQQELIQLKEVATHFEGFDNKPIILNNNNNNNNNLTWTNKDIARLNPEQVVQTLNISFSEPKSLYPKPFKYGVIGMVIGLVLAFVWMMAGILIAQLRQKS